MSRETRKYRGLYVLFFILSTICFLLPAMIFAGIGIAVFSAAAGFKVFAGCLVAAAVLAIVDCIRQAKIRTAVWVVLAGFMMVATLPMAQFAIVATAISVVVDEFILMPLSRHFKSKWSINAEIDKRGE